MFHYKGCGLDNVFLKNGFVETETDYGAAISIADLEGLHRVIGMQISECRSPLTEQEFRFLRKELDLSQQHLGNILGVSESSIRNWEKGRSKVDPSAGKLIRVLYIEHMTGDGVIRDILEKLSELNVSEHCKRIELETTDGGWKQAA